MKIFKGILSTALKLALIAFIAFCLTIFYVLLMIFVDFKIIVATLLFPLTLALFAIAWLLPSAWARGKRYVVNASVAIFCAGIIATLSMVGYNVYLDSIRIVDNLNINTEEYLPFDENSKIATLDEQSTLKFKITDDLPIIDGAAALFPTYSAFVNAVYPSNIPPLNRADSPFKYNNTGVGYSKLIGGETDLFIGVEPDYGTKSYAEREGVEFEYTPIGSEAFVFFTNAHNPVKNLTIEQIKGIYSGEITNWSQVGGESLEIQVFMRNGNSGSSAALYRILGDIEVIEPKKDFVFDLMSGIVQAASDYENHRGAIGFSYRYYVSDIVAENGIRFIPIEGVEPTSQSVTSQEYPFIENLLAVTIKGKRTENTQKLIDWILSPQGQYLIEKSGYAPIA